MFNKSYKEERCAELTDRTKIAIGHFHDKVERFCNRLAEGNDDSKKETLYSNQGILYALEYLFDFDGDKCIGLSKGSIKELLEEKKSRND